MKKIFVLALSLFISLSFFACSDDDDETKELTYKGMKVSEFKMYVGSDEGGKEIDTKNLNPQTFWEEDYSELDSIKNFKYLFEGDSLITINIQENEITDVQKYKSHSDSLFILDETWDFLGIGNENSFKTIAGLLRIRNVSGDMEIFKTSMDEHDYTLEKVLEFGGFKSLSDMKSNKDTVMWCNIHFFYEK